MAGMSAPIPPSMRAPAIPAIRRSVAEIVQSWGSSLVKPTAVSDSHNFVLYCPSFRDYYNQRFARQGLRKRLLWDGPSRRGGDSTPQSGDYDRMAIPLLLEEIEKKASEVREAQARARRWRGGLHRGLSRSWSGRARSFSGLCQKDESPKSDGTGSEALLGDDTKTLLDDTKRILERVMIRTVERREKDMDAVKESLQKIMDSKDVFETLDAVKEARLTLKCDAAAELNEMNFYQAIVRIRLAYSFLVLVALVLAIFSGGLMQFFFTVFSNTGRASALTAFGFWCLPFVGMMNAWLGDEIIDLVFDGFDFPPLTKFMATLMAYLHSDPLTPPSLSLCRCVDLVMLCLLEVAPLLAGLYATTCSYSFVYGYVQGMLISAMWLAIIFVVSDVVVNVRKVGTESAAGNAQATADAMQQALDGHKIFPGEICSKRAAFGLYFHSAKEEYSKFDRNIEGRAEDFGALKRAAAITVAAWTATCVLFHFNFLEPHTTIAVFFIVTFVLSVVAMRGLGDVLGPSFIIILTIFILLAVGMVVAGNDVKLPAGSLSPIMVAAGAGGNASLPSSWRGASTPYPVCHLEWGAAGAALSSLDLASLAWIVYEPDCSRVGQLLETSFPHLAPQLLHCTPYDDIPRWASFYFPPSDNSGNGTHVVSVKGTSTLQDVFVDADIFATIKVMQIFDVVEPLLSILPTDVVQWILRHLRVSLWGGTPEDQIWQTLEDRVRALRERHGGSKFILTGHSLGGGVAEIVAAKLGLPALVWSAPGMKYSASRFGISMQAAKREVVVVVPEKDLVPQVDVQVGVVQQIQCRKRDGTQEGSVGCHSLVKTACEVWRVCGDDAGRDFSGACADSVDRQDLGNLYPS